MKETWKPVTGREDEYEVSDLGRVRNVRTGYMLKIGYGNSGGYAMVLRGVYVHHLVMAAFVGPREPGVEVRHKDRNPRNAALSNLLYGTSSDNKFDQVRDGTHPEARRTHCDNGHEYTEENTRVDRYPDGTIRNRACRACTNARYQAFKARRKANRDKICLKSGCDVVAMALSLCSTHYAQDYRARKRRERDGGDKTAAL